MIDFLQPMIVKRGIVNRMQNELFGYQGWPSVCRDENGVLYAVASSFRMKHVCPFGKTAMFISHNNGETWTPPIVINDTLLDDRDAGIVYLGHGKMLVTWFAHPVTNYTGVLHDGIVGKPEDVRHDTLEAMLEWYKTLPQDIARGGSFLRVSEDYGVTWSDVIRTPVNAPHGPTLLKNGTLLYLGKELFTGGFEGEPISAWVSRDAGLTWEKRGDCPKPNGYKWNNFHEAHTVQLPSGKIIGMIRGEGEGVPCHGFTMFQTESLDNGVTWSPYVCTDIYGTPPHLLYHSSGALICSYSRREAPFGEFAMVSRDDGKTWATHFVLDGDSDNGDLGYPASVELADGSIVTVYYQHTPCGNGQYDTKPSVMFTHWRLPE